MMRRFTQFVLPILAAAFFVSCNAIEKLTEREVELDDLEISLQCPTRATLDYTRTFSLNDPEFADIKKHIGWVKLISFQNIQVSGPAGKSVTNMVFTATVGQTALADFTVESHNFTTPYSNAAVNTFVQKVLGEIIAKKSVTIAVTGATDMEAGDALDLKLKVISPVIRAGLNL